MFIARLFFVMLVVFPAVVCSQALDRTHVNYFNPLQYGATCDATTLNSAISAIGSRVATLILTKTDREKVYTTTSKRSWYYIGEELLRKTVLSWLVDDLFAGLINRL